MSNTKTLTANDLHQFSGSENWYRHSLNRKVLYTDGAQYLAEQGGGFAATRFHRHRPNTCQSGEGGSVSGVDAEGESRLHCPAYL